jgi:hypothetical protein
MARDGGGCCGDRGGEGGNEADHRSILYDSRLCSGPETVAAAVVNTMVEVQRIQQPRLLIIQAFESSLCSGPETLASAVMNTVVEVEVQQPNY